MTICDPSDGVTLVEVVIVVAVIGILAGGALPLVGAIVDGDRRAEARAELERISSALESYYSDRGSFPTTLTDPSFYGTHLQPGVGGTVVLDPFGVGSSYRYELSSDPDTAVVYSLGENRRDDGASVEEFAVRVAGAVPGLRVSRRRLEWLSIAIADHRDGGGSLTGDWSVDRGTLQLAVQQTTDGFGTPIRMDPVTGQLTCAGPDRRFGSQDDLVF